MDFKAERKAYEAVAKMTGLELAKIEADEMHPLYEIACEEIDARAKNPHVHAIDTINEIDKYADAAMASHYDFHDREFMTTDLQSDEAARLEREAAEEAEHRSWTNRDYMYADDYVDYSDDYFYDGLYN